MSAEPGQNAVSPASVVDWDLLSILAISSALTAAETTGLLDAVREREQTAAECAAGLSLHERTTKCVLDVLTAIGLLQRHGERYRMPAGPSLPTHYPRGLLTIMQDVFAQTTRVLRTGEPITWIDSLVTREARYSTMVGELGHAYADIAAHLAKQIAVPPARILDIGCGSGVWSLAIAAQHPQAHVTGLDLPAVLHEFTARARGLGLEDRIAPLPGDMFEVALPAGHFDLVVIANVLRLDSEAQARRLLGRAAEVLRPGGQLLVVDAMAAGMPEKELIRAAYSLLLHLRTKTGNVYLPEQIRDFMATAGFSNVRELDCQVRLTEVGALLGDSSHAAVTA